MTATKLFLRLFSTLTSSVFCFMLIIYIVLSMAARIDRNAHSSRHSITTTRSHVSQVKYSHRRAKDKPITLRPPVFALLLLRFHWSELVCQQHAEPQVAEDKPAGQAKSLDILRANQERGIRFPESITLRKAIAITTAPPHRTAPVMVLGRGSCGVTPKAGGRG